MHLDDCSCAMCVCQDDESVEHLFLSCPFAVASWNSIGLHVDTNVDPFAALQDLKLQLTKPFFFMEIIYYPNMVEHLDHSE